VQHGGSVGNEGLLREVGEYGHPAGGEIAQGSEQGGHRAGLECEAEKRAFGICRFTGKRLSPLRLMADGGVDIPGDADCNFPDFSETPLW